YPVCCGNRKTQKEKNCSSSEIAFGESAVEANLNESNRRFSPWRSFFVHSASGSAFPNTTWTRERLHKRWPIGFDLKAALPSASTTISHPTRSSAFSKQRHRILHRSNQ